MHTLTDTVLGEAERLERQRQRELAQQAKKEAHRKEALTRKLRNKYYRKISTRLGLATEHNQDLINRGLTQAQIDFLNSFTLDGITYLPDDIPSNLPGVRIDKLNRKYLSSVSKIEGTGTWRDSKSFFCPAFDYEGNIIGGQFRHNCKENKYTWLKGIKSAHLPNGELPITFVSAEKVSFGEKNSETTIQQWIDNCPHLTDIVNKIVGCGQGSNTDGVNDTDHETPKHKIKAIMPLEGLLKPFVASCRLGVDTMGASGFNFSGSPEQVQEIINQGGYNFTILPLDSGAVGNKMIMNQLDKNVELFKSLGCELAIAWWDQVDKDSGKDFDEIESLNQVRLITYEEVKEIAEKEIFKKLKDDLLKKLTKFTRDKIISRRRFYADGATSDTELDTILDTNKVTIIKGAKKLGKSYMAKQIIKRWRAKGGKVINISSRRVLGQAQSIEWDITYIADAEEDSFSLTVVFERDAGIGAVVDSLLKLKNLDWSGCLIIIDEIEQFVPHTLTANTAVKDKRGYILQALEDKFREALATGGKIIGLDADASDVSSDWLEGVTGIKPFKLENIHKAHNNNAYIFRGDKNGYKDLIDNIINDLRNNEKIFLASDSRKDLEAILLELKKLFPDLPMEIVTSDTVSDKYIRDFILNPDESIENTHVAFLGGSPVMQSGVSINIKNYFSKVYGICTGIVEPSVMRQLLARVRDDVDRYLWIADKPRGVYSNDFDWQKILKDDFAESLPDLVHYFDSLDENLTNSEKLDKIKALLDENDRLTDIHSITKAKIKARRNLALSNYRENLINELKAEGYQVHDDYSTSTPTLGLNISETKAKITEHEADCTYNADDITDIEAESISKKAYPTAGDRHKLTKYNIKTNLPLLTLSPLFILHYILKDRWKLIQAVKRFWFTQNQDIAKHLDTKAVHYQSKVGLTGGKFWLEDVKANMPYLELFERLGLSEFINDVNLVINKDSELVKTFFKGCKDYHRVNGISNRELLRSCGIKFKNSISPIVLLTKVLELFGHQTKFINRSTEGDRLRNYRIVRKIEIINKDTGLPVINSNQLWTELMNSFEEKYQNLEPIEYDFEVENEGNYYPENYHFVSFDDERAISDTEHGINPRPHLTDLYNNIGGCGQTSNQDEVSNTADKVEKQTFSPEITLNNHYENEDTVTNINESNLTLPEGFYDDSEPDFWAEDNQENGTNNQNIDTGNDDKNSIFDFNWWQKQINRRMRLITESKSELIEGVLKKVSPSGTIHLDIDKCKQWWLRGMGSYHYESFEFIT